MDGSEQVDEVPGEGEAPLGAEAERILVAQHSAMSLAGAALDDQGGPAEERPVQVRPEDGRDGQNARRELQQGLLLAQVRLDDPRACVLTEDQISVDRSSYRCATPH